MWYSLVQMQRTCSGASTTTPAGTATTRASLAVAPLMTEKGPPRDAAREFWGGGERGGEQAGEQAGEEAMKGEDECCC